MIARAATLAALLGTILSLWLAAAPLLGRVFGRGEALASSAGTLNDPAPPAVADLGPVLDFAPFGWVEGAQVAQLDPGAPVDLSLLGITTAQDPKASRAIIAGGDDGVGSYSIGAQIAEGIILTGVLADHVTLSIGGQDQPLHFPSDSGAALVQRVAPVQAIPDPAADAAGFALKLGQYRAEILQDLPGLLDRLGLQPTDLGYRVTPDALPDLLQTGLQPGDLIARVNGQPLGDPARAAELFDQAAALGLASLTVLRDGQERLMPFPLK